MRFRIACLSPAIFILLAPIVSWVSPVSAANAADWRAGNIIEDAVFMNAGSMSVEQIQAFLNEKVPICDTWGQKNVGYYYNSSSGRVRFSWFEGGSWVTTTRAVYADRYNAYFGTTDAARPFKCLKDYYEVPKTSPGAGLPASNFASNDIPPGARSAAQLIADAAAAHNISPQVLLVKLGTESAGPLTTDDWPFRNQYLYAMGAHCPDSGPGGSANCDANYAGFSLQMMEAAKLLRGYLNNMQQSWWPYKKPYQTNHILWNVEPSGCGGGDVFIENKATAALYTYTPYQPNQAALNNLYGTGDGCSAYGNRNFWRVFIDWFGYTRDARLFYRVVQGDQSPEVYLQTYQGKYYVPSYTLLAEWGMDAGDVVRIPQSQVNNIPTRSTLSNVLTDGSGNLYVVQSGGLHKVSSPDYTAAWGVDVGNMVESLGLSISLPKREPLGRFMTMKGGDGSIWLADGSNRHLIQGGSMQYAWGYYPGAAITVSEYLFARYAEKNGISQYAVGGNGQTFAIDAGTRRLFKNQSTRDAYVGQSTPTQVRNETVSLIPEGQAITIFAIDKTSNKWFLIDSGRKRYVPRGELVSLWGKPDNEPFTLLTGNFASNIPEDTMLSFVARTASSPTYWLIAKEKHAIPNGNSYASLVGHTNAPDVFSDSLIESLPTGGAFTGSIKGAQSPYNYSYLLESGGRRYASNAAAQQAWIVNPITVPNQLMTLVPEKSFIGESVVKDSLDNPFYIERGVKYPIQSNLSGDWGVTDSTSKMNSALLNSQPTGSSITTNVIKSTSSAVYIIAGGKKIPAAKHTDIVATKATPLPLTLDGLSSAKELTYLVMSSSPSDSRMWLLTDGVRVPLSAFEMRVAFGYISNQIEPTKLSPATLDTLPVSTSPFSNLIQKPSSGIKFLNFGHSLGFPDSPTLVSHINQSSQILQVSPSIFDSIPLKGSVSRVVYDDAGRYWWIDEGKKHYITSWSAYQSKGYPSAPHTYLYGTTMNLIPTGPQIQ